MWAFIFRKLLYNIPVYLSIIFLMMLALRVQDPVYAYLGKNPSQAQYDAYAQEMGLDKSFVHQYVTFMGKIVTGDFSETSWAQQGKPVKDILIRSIPPSLSVTVPTLFTSVVVSVVIALLSAYYRGRPIDKVLMVVAVLGMSISYLVYIIFGQFFFAGLPASEGAYTPFAIQGYEAWFPLKFESGHLLPSINEDARLINWVTYCLLPVLIGVVVAMGYDTRFYRAVMVEECNRDYIVTATAKGASKQKIIFVHMLKNAMIPVITRVMSSLPFLITGSILIEIYFNIPGMGRELIGAIGAKDFPVIQSFVAVFAFIFILSVILTDVLYALVDPRVRLS